MSEVKINTFTLSEFKKYHNVVVTGPQRSGTRIAAKMIAKDCGICAVNEETSPVHDVTNLCKLLSDEYRRVIHAPALSSIVHLLTNPSTVVVFMRRKLVDIKSSQERINWTKNYEPIEKAMYFDSTNVAIADTKYRAWDGYQKPAMQVDYCELEYEPLKNHSLWINQLQRKDFVFNQTTLKESK